jgi:hypothetical protein
MPTRGPSHHMRPPPVPKLMKMSMAGGPGRSMPPQLRRAHFCRWLLMATARGGPLQRGEAPRAPWHRQRCAARRSARGARRSAPRRGLLAGPAPKGAIWALVWSSRLRGAERKRQWRGGFQKRKT